MTVRKQAAQRNLSWLYWLGGVVLVSALTVGGYMYWQQRGSATSSGTQAQFVTLTKQPYRMTIAGPGTLAASESFDVSTDVSGTILSIASEGDRVTKGDIVAQLDPSDANRDILNATLALEKAQAQYASLNSSLANSDTSLSESLANARLNVADAERELAQAQDTLALTQQLFELGSESAEAVRDAQDDVTRLTEALISAQASVDTLSASQSYQQDGNAQDLRNAELAVQQAELTLEEAQADLASTTIYAPFDGVVSSVAVQPGSNVFSEGVLMTLIDDTTVELEAQVDETEIGQVAVGQSAELSLDAFPDETFTGVVTSISPEGRVESNIPIFDVTISLENPDLTLRPGMTAEAEIIVSEIENTATLSSTAVRTQGERSIIQVQQDDGSFAPAPVTVIDTIGLNTIIQTDLEDGTVVLIPGSESVTTSNNNQQQGVGLPGLGGPPAGGFNGGNRPAGGGGRPQ